jgi:UDP-glucose 4-epimerase
VAHQAYLKGERFLLVVQKAQGFRVLVTGGAGFIGSHAVDRLVGAGCRVIVLDDFSTGRRDNLARWAGDRRVAIVEADVAEDLTGPLAAATRFDVIVHLAARAAAARSVEDPLDDLRVNYAGTARILEYARQIGVRRVIFASSSAVYGNDVELPTPEEAAMRPLSPYGVNKLASERLLDCYGSSWGLSWTALRFFNVYGPRQHPGSPYSGVISIFARQALAGEPLTINGDGRQTRDFVFVDDVVRALVDVCLRDVASAAIINLGTGVETSIDGLARLLLELSGGESELRHGPSRAGDIRRSVARVDRASEFLGYQPEVALRDGLRKTLEWIRGPRSGRA